MTRPTGQRASGDGRGVDCIADSAGGITFDVTGAACSGNVLVLRLRGRGDEVRLPLTEAGGSRLRAVLPSTVDLAEGHWDICSGATGEPVRPGLRDVRALVGRIPEESGVAVRVPYPTAGGALAVRSWVRAPHAEAGTIRCEHGDTITIEGRVYGAGIREGALAEARPRGGGRVHRTPVTGADGDFTFLLAYGPLAGEPLGKGEHWDLWLLPEPGGPRIRISRILDDVWDKRHVFVYPKHVTDQWQAVPAYTGDNDLCVRVDPAPVPASR